MDRIKIQSSIDPINIESEINETTFTPDFMGKLDIAADLTELLTTSGITADSITISEELLNEINQALKELDPVIPAKEPVKVYGPNIRAKNSNGEYVALYAGAGGGERDFLSKGVEHILRGEQNA